VLDIHQGQMFNLNPVGSRILELLESGSAEAYIVEAISREFNVNRELVQNDVREFIESLKKHKLVAERS
jgi:Coenzyme PQQ synthesis protein D (PqqD)